MTNAELKTLLKDHKLFGLVRDTYNDAQGTAAEAWGYDETKAHGWAVDRVTVRIQEAFWRLGLLEAGDEVDAILIQALIEDIGV